MTMTMMMIAMALTQFSIFSRRCNTQSRKSELVRITSGTEKRRQFIVLDGLAIIRGCGDVNLGVPELPDSCLLLLYHSGVASLLVVVHDNRQQLGTALIEQITFIDLL